MLKIFIFLPIFISNIFASNIEFKEEKFVSSLQTSVYKQGLIEFQDEFIKVSYKNLSTSFVFFNDYLIIKDGQKEERFNYDEKIELALFYKLIKLIYQNKEDNIEEYFKVEKNKNETILTPNEYLSNSILKIEYKKEKEKLSFLKIDFKNEDYIKIVQN